MRRAIAPLLLLAGCAVGDPPDDLAGHVYPAECTVAAAIAEPASRIAIDPAILETMSEQFNKRELGLWLPPLNGGPATIFYDETARGWELADIQRHEGCHQIRYRLTGDARWHK